MRVASEFFELPLEERNKIVSKDMMKAVRYNTRFNHLKHGEFYWRDFLKHDFHPLDKTFSLWPSNPFDYW